MPHSYFEELGCFADLGSRRIADNFSGAWLTAKRSAYPEPRLIADNHKIKPSRSTALLVVVRSDLLSPAADDPLPLTEDPGA
jgi:hypothetical protein